MDKKYLIYYDTENGKIKEKRVKDWIYASEISVDDTINYIEVDETDYNKIINSKCYIDLDTKKVIEISTEDLTITKLKKEQELSDKFKSYVTGGFTTTLGYVMQFDVDDSIKMEGAIKLLEQSGENGYITDYYNETHYDISLDKMKQIQLEMLLCYSKAHIKKQQLRQNIKDSSNISELNQINIEF